MRTEVLSINDFLHGREKEGLRTKLERHFKKYGTVYKIAGVTVILLTCGAGGTLASSGIDIEATKLYKELLGIGKWIIIFKGGIDTLKSIGSGDFDSAKKSFFSYLLTYLFLLALPYGMEKIDVVFSNIRR